MTAMRIFGLLFLTIAITVVMVSDQRAQPPAPKPLPQIKNGQPPVPPAKQPPVDPKPKNPAPVPMPVPQPPVGGLPPGIGFPPLTPGVVQPPAVAKKDDIKWPKDVNGKTLEVVIKEMRTNGDPAIRESAIRTLPLFGPKSRDLGVMDLLDAMTKENDWNVRGAAFEVAPTILMGFAKGPDTPLSTGLTTIGNLLTSEHFHFRFQAVAIVGGIGPYMRTAYPKVVVSLTSRAKEGTSWQMRRSAVGALGSVGQGVQTGESAEDKAPPDMAAVSALLDIMRTDACASVRREAVNSLIGVGPVNSTQLKAWKLAFDNLFKFEKDKSVILWARVCILRNDPNGLKGNEAHLNEIAKVLEAPEPGGRLEACQALATLGEDAITKLQNLIDVAQQPKEENAVVVAAIMAIVTMPSKDALTVPILTKIKTEHVNKEVREAAEEAIKILAEGKKNKKP